MKSFRDPVSGVLKAFGFVESNAPGDLAQAEADDFALEPGKWQLVADIWTAYQAPAGIPGEVTMRQAQLAMLAFTYPDGSNLLDKVNTLISQQPRSSQITWSASSSVQRGNALIAGLQPALGLTDAQIDQLFINAAAL